MSSLRRWANSLPNCRIFKCSSFCWCLFRAELLSYKIPFLKNSDLCNEDNWIVLNFWRKFLWCCIWASISYLVRSGEPSSILLVTLVRFLGRPRVRLFSPSNLLTVIEFSYKLLSRFELWLMLDKSRSFLNLRSVGPLLLPFSTFFGSGDDFFFKSCIPYRTFLLRVSQSS